MITGRARVRFLYCPAAGSLRPETSCGAQGGGHTREAVGDESDRVRAKAVEALGKIGEAAAGVAVRDWSAP